VMAGPTPVVSGGSIAFWARTGAADGPASVGVYDTRGRKVRELFQGELSAGSERLFSWDGTDGGGVQAAAGVYFVRFEAPGVHLGRRLVLL
jgi:flagellar hook assembly protein FlgD